MSDELSQEQIDILLASNLPEDVKAIVRAEGKDMVRRTAEFRRRAAELRAERLRLEKT